MDIKIVFKDGSTFTLKDFYRITCLHEDGLCYNVQGLQGGKIVRAPDVQNIVIGEEKK